MDKDLTVIVPIYNTEKELLVKCLESLINQTYLGLNIILVDDASTNEMTKRVLQDYTQKYNDQITLITHEKNGRQGKARNTGIQYAKTKYITFVDSDDYCHLQMYEKMMNKLREMNADVVDCDLFIVKNGVEIYEVSNYPDAIGQKNDERQKALILHSGRYVSKIFERSIWTEQEIYFPENILYEDNALGGLPILAAQNIAKVNEALYYYVAHDNSTVHNMQANYHDRMTAGKQRLESYKRFELDLKFPEEAYWRFFAVYFLNNYRLVMKYEKEYMPILKAMFDEVYAADKNILNNKYYKQNVKLKHKIRIFLLNKYPKLFEWYVGRHYRK